MEDPQPVDGDVRYANQRWERYDRDLGWIPVDSSATGEETRGGFRQVYLPPRQDE